MSEYTVVKVIFNDEQMLIQSLEDMGYTAEVFTEGVTLSNNYSNSKPMAHIVVRSGQFGGMGDLGFEKTTDGFKMHVDDYDYGKYGKKFSLEKLNQTYSENKLKKYVNSNSMCNVASRKENKNGQIEIHLRVNT